MDRLDLDLHTLMWLARRTSTSLLMVPVGSGWEVRNGESTHQGATPQAALVKFLDQAVCRYGYSHEGRD